MAESTWVCTDEQHCSRPRDAPPALGRRTRAAILRVAGRLAMRIRLCARDGRCASATACAQSACQSRLTGSAGGLGRPGCSCWALCVPHRNSVRVAVALRSGTRARWRCVLSMNLG